MSDLTPGVIVSQEIDETKKAVQNAINRTTSIVISQITGTPITPQQQDQRIADLTAQDEDYKKRREREIAEEFGMITAKTPPDLIPKKLKQAEQVINTHHQEAEMLGIAKQNPDQQNIPQGPEIAPARVMSGSVAVDGKSEKPILTKQQELRTATKEGTSSHE